MSIEQAQQTSNGDGKAAPTSLKRARLRLAAEIGRDVTQEEMAKKIGIHRSRYSALELGTYPPGKRLARKIAEITGQTIGEVIDEYDQRRAV